MTFQDFSVIASRVFTLDEDGLKVQENNEEPGDSINRAPDFFDQEDEEQHPSLGNVESLFV